MSAPSTISMSGVQFGYDPEQPAVLRDLSLEMPAGSLTAILGPNGGGKTTLLHLLLGLLTPQAGTLHIAGQQPSRYSRRELSRIIGLVPQQEHIPFDFSLLDYVLLGRAPYLGALDQPGAEDRRCALKALETTGLGSLRERAVTTLSGGER
ncbi:MAG: ABC transporter ATP-binding protein, partial [Lentisphaerota bacterium]